MRPRGRIILVFPKTMPDRQGGDCWTLLPLSLLSIATPLLWAGYDVRLLDQRIDPDWRSTLEWLLADEDVLCVGVSAMTGLPVHGAIAAAELVRGIAPRVPIVWGGVHGSLLPEQTAASPLVDYVVIGEGERAMLGIADALWSGEDPLSVPGVFAMRDGVLTGTDRGEPLDMDVLARPAYKLVDIERYLNAPFMTTQRPLAFVTSRGCPSRCRYCYNLAFNKGCWRSMSGERVLGEIRHLVDGYGVDSVFLLDDNFFGDWARVTTICRSLIAEDVRVQFLNANCRVAELDRRTSEDLELLRRAGFQKLFVGVESGSDEILRAVRKGATVEQVRRVNRRLREAGIVPVYSFMIGFPGETVGQMKDTLALMLELVEEYPDAVVNAANVFSPFPGTPLYDEAVASGMPVPGSLAEWADLDYVSVSYREGFTPRQIAFIETASYLSDLLDPKPLANRTGLVAAGRRAYAHVARWRARNRFYAVMPEAGFLARRRAGWGAAAAS